MLLSVFSLEQLSIDHLEQPYSRKSWLSWLSWCTPFLFWKFKIMFCWKNKTLQKKVDGRKSSGNKTQRCTPPPFLVHSRTTSVSTQGGGPGHEQFINPMLMGEKKIFLLKIHNRNTEYHTFRRKLLYSFKPGSIVGAMAWYMSRIREPYNFKTVKSET